MKFFKRKQAHGSFLASMVPPWIKYPIIPASSIGWRVEGDAKEYLAEFEYWWIRLEDAQVASYVDAYPVPTSWEERHTDWEEKRKNFVPKV